jgi:hypothetical protein
MLAISGVRERLANEIEAVSAENSHTVEDNTGQVYSAENAIDLDLNTRARLESDTDDVWIKIKLSAVHTYIASNRL